MWVFVQDYSTLYSPYPHHISVLSNKRNVVWDRRTPPPRSHYWDYTVDALANATYAQSVIFDEEWFGSAQPTDDRHVVSTGRWAYTPVLSDARAFSNVTNPYGLLRSPWNTNPTPYLTRAGTVIGVETADYVLPSCTDFRSYVNKSGTPNGLIRIADVVSALNGALHGPVHIMIGGHWGFNESVVAKVEALHSIGGDAFTDQILLGAKVGEATHTHAPHTHTRRPPSPKRSSGPESDELEDWGRRC